MDVRGCWCGVPCGGGGAGWPLRGPGGGDGAWERNSKVLIYINVYTSIHNIDIRY